MSTRTNHVSSDRLTTMAFAAHAPETAQDEQALLHVAECDRCAADLARFTADAESLRAAAFARSDAIFDEGALEAQRARILDRLASLGQVARVLRFPRREREVAMPVTTGSRRWISVAAAAGLIIGLVAGQLLHFLPTDVAGRRDAGLLLQAPRPTGNAIVAVTGPGPSATDDQFLDEVEAAVQLRRAHSLVISAICRCPDDDGKASRRASQQTGCRSWESATLTR
jgi:hypothetical protein